ncbi:hypothetical protein BGX31_007593, partial [Mortierella sp. GBA43]
MTTQEFRALSSSQVISIPIRHDNKTRKWVIRWKDIQQHFKGAQAIMNGKKAVLFLTDDNLEEIAEHQGVVLEVVVEDSAQSNSDTSKAFDAYSQALVIRPHGQGHTVDTPVSLHVDTLPHEIPEPNKPEPQHQEGLRQLEQRVQQMERQMGEMLQHIQGIRQIVDDVSRQIQQSEKRIQEQLQDGFCGVHQKIQQLEESVNEANKCSLLSQDQIYEKRLNHQNHIHDRIQALLSVTPRDPSTLRLFIILPKRAEIEGGQERLSSGHFQLHLLCECGSYTTGKSARELREVHLTNQTGYDLKNPTEFFNKYGWYLLTTMYIIKYGSMTQEFVVLPLAQSKFLTRMEESQKDHGFIRNTFIRLVDDTITFLEGITRATPSDTDNQPRENPELANLEELKSYLVVNEDEHFPGDLYSLTTQEGHYSWVCGEHQREELESAKQCLKDLVNAMGGTYTTNPDKIDINPTSDVATKRLRDAIAKIHRIQRTGKESPLIVNCGQFSLTIDTSRDVQDLSMTVDRLGDLTMEDLDFISQWNPTQFAIKFTPQSEDEDSLNTIIQKGSKLKRLCIGCGGKRSLDLINLFISAREKILQDEKSTARSTFELMEEGLKSLDMNRDWDNHDHIAATLTFSEGSIKFDIDTRVVLRAVPVIQGDWIDDFFREYGWSITCLTTTLMFSDHLAALLDKATQIHGSKLTRLIFTQYSLTTTGMDAIDRIIKRSQRLEYLRLNLFGLGCETQLEKAVLSLERYGVRLNGLHLAGHAVESWLPRTSQTFPIRSCFPMMDALFVACIKQEFPRESIPWLVAMVSTPPQLSGSGLGEDSCSGTFQQTTATMSSKIATRLKTLQLHRFTFRPQDWEALIKALDFSALLTLTLKDTSLSQEQLGLLLDQIALTDTALVPLEKLDLTGTNLLVDVDRAALRAKILKVAPRVSIV